MSGRLSSRGGRPAKPGARAPSGRLSRARAAQPARDPRRIALEQRRQRGADPSNADHPYWGTPWGRLQLAGALDQAEHDTADGYARLLAQVRRIQGLGRPWARSVAPEPGRSVRGRVSAMEDLSEADAGLLALADEATARLKRLPNGVSRCLDRMVRLEQDPAPEDLDAIRAGLSSLASLFRPPRRPLTKA